MAEKSKERMALVTEGTASLQKMREEREALSSEMYAELEETEAQYKKLDADNLSEAEIEGRTSKLEETLAQYGSYKATIADLTSGLTDSLSTYVQFAGESANYQGWEKFHVSIPIFGGKQKADRMRDARLRNQSPRENLQLILDYGEQLYKEICEVRSDALSTFERLEKNQDVIVGKIAEFKPKESNLKARLDAMEEKYATLEAKQEQAEGDAQAKLSGDLNKMRPGLTELRNEYDQVFTIYNQAQQAYRANLESQNSFEQMVRDLGRQATMVQEKIDNVTQIYLAAPEAIKVAMTTKGMEDMDKAVNAATAQSVDYITKAAAAVSDATLAREETPLVAPEVMKGFMDRMEDLAQDFNTRYAAVQENAHKSQKERYNIVDAA